MRLPARARRAFTLLEILIVIGILALVAAILIPAVRGARGAARKCVCAVNLREIGRGLFQYAEDHRGLMPADPPARKGQSTCFLRSTGQISGLGRLHPKYSPAIEVFFCPVDPDSELGLPAWKRNEPLVSSHFMYRATDAGADPQLSKNTDKAIVMGIMRFEREHTWPGHSEGTNVLWGDTSVSFLKAMSKEVNFNPIYVDEPFLWADKQR